MNTTIANRIYIENPSEDVQLWAMENLKFPNPEYEKKQRMGFWLGRTPKSMRLYEWNGNTLVLPFGVCREIMPLLKVESFGLKDCLPAISLPPPPVNVLSLGPKDFVPADIPPPVNVLSLGLKLPLE